MLARGEVPATLDWALLSSVENALHHEGSGAGVVSLTPRKALAKGISEDECEVQLFERHRR
jgi:hypothetical protein